MKNLKIACLMPVAMILCGGCAASPPPEASPPPPSAAAPSAVPSSPTPPPATVAASVTPVATPAATKLSPPIDEKLVADTTGVEKPEKAADGSIKVSFPRKDVEVSVDGWKMPPFMGVTSWAAFAPGREGVAEAMVMGDLVLFEDEVNPVMSKLLGSGVQVTALHNHFFYDTPHVYFMHIGGEGKTLDLSKGVKAAMDEVAAIRKKSPKPTTTFGAAKLPAKNSIDATKLDAALDTKGQAKDGIAKSTKPLIPQLALSC